MDELADRAHRLRLPALEMADEVPAEGVAVQLVLRLEVLRPVLSDHLHPGFGQDLAPPERRTSSPPRRSRPDRPRPGFAYRSLTSSGDSGDHALAAGGSPVTAV